MGNVEIAKIILEVYILSMFLNCLIYLLKLNNLLF